MHYYFQASENAPATDPVTLWMNGGPGKLTEKPRCRRALYALSYPRCLRHSAREKGEALNQALVCARARSRVAISLPCCYMRSLRVRLLSSTGFDKPSPHRCSSAALYLFSVAVT